MHLLRRMRVDWPVISVWVGAQFFFFLPFPPLLPSLTLNRTWLAVCEAPETVVTTTKDELMKFLKEMYTMRRMEITNDNEYKVSQPILGKKPPRFAC